MKSKRITGVAQLNAANQHYLWRQLVLILLSVFPAATGFAQSTFKLTVSDSFSSPTAGFEYRHVEVATTNGLPSAKDVTVWCHVEIANNWGRYTKMIQPIPVTLKAGEVFVKKDLYLPSGGQSGNARFSLAATGNSSRKELLQSGWIGEEFQDVLIIDDVGGGESSVTFNRNKRVAPVVQTPPRYQIVSAKTPSGDRIPFSSLHSKIAYLPKRWIGYSSIEQVIINRADLAALARDAERFGALIQWVAMGGALVVSDCGDDFSNIASLMRYFNDGESRGVSRMTLYAPSTELKFECAKLVSNQPPLAQKLGGSRLFNSRMLGRMLGRVSDNLDKRRFTEDWTEISAAVGKDGGLELEEDTDALLHRFGLGGILFHSDPAEDLSGAQLSEACFLCIVARRHYSVLGSNNVAGDCHGKLQLMNVGIAPVGLFMFVVVSFMTLIGPVGYSYLKIKRKLNHQIWMVPLISALACLLLLMYALLSEGVGTKLRPTIFVELDQNRKVAATFARYSVYSALQPPPYQFNDDQFATLENAEDQTPAVYSWSDQGYRLSGGNASARNVHQVFVATPVKTNSGIEIKKSIDSESPKSLRLTNKFNDHVKLLALKVDGEFYFAFDLAPSETQIRAPSVDGEFSQSPEVKEMLLGRIPANTQDYRFNRRSGFYNQRSTNYRKEWDVGVKQIYKFRLASGIEEHLEDGHYIAILDSITEVPSVVTGAREIDGSVIVHGKW